MNINKEIIVILVILQLIFLIIGLIIGLSWLTILLAPILIIFAGAVIGALMCAFKIGGE
jgi:hypothetical protein